MIYCSLTEREFDTEACFVRKEFLTAIVHDERDVEDRENREGSGRTGRVEVD